MSKKNNLDTKDWSSKIFEHEGFDYFFTDYFGPHNSQETFGNEIAEAHKAFLDAREVLVNALEAIGISEGEL